jgi:hypothetical protein
MKNEPSNTHIPYMRPMRPMRPIICGIEPNDAENSYQRGMSSLTTWPTLDAGRLDPQHKQDWINLLWHKTNTKRIQILLWQINWRAPKMVFGASARVMLWNACIITIYKKGKHLKQCFIKCTHMVISQGMFGGLSKAQGGVLASFMLSLRRWKLLWGLS